MKGGLELGGTRAEGFLIGALLLNANFAGVEGGGGVEEGEAELKGDPIWGEEGCE